MSYQRTYGSPPRMSGDMRTGGAQMVGGAGPSAQQKNLFFKWLNEREPDLRTGPEEAVDPNELTTQQKWQMLSEFMQGFGVEEWPRPVVVSQGGGARLNVSDVGRPSLLAEILSRMAGGAGG